MTNSLDLISPQTKPVTNIAQYTILSKIGEGGTGEVYRARDPKLDRDVATTSTRRRIFKCAERGNKN